jgi:lysozyme
MIKIINQKGIDLIKEFEGFSETVYICPGGHPTIGYGHVVKPHEDFSCGISKMEAENLLREDIKIAENAVQQMVHVPLNPNQFAALVSLTFNIGAANFARSTLLKSLNAYNYAAAAEHFESWVYAKGIKLEGLARRRRAERTLFEDKN